MSEGNLSEIIEEIRITPDTDLNASQMSQVIDAATKLVGEDAIFVRDTYSKSITLVSKTISDKRKAEAEERRRKSAELKKDRANDEADEPPF